MPQQKIYVTKAGTTLVFPDDATPEEMQALADAADRPPGRSLAGFGENVLSSAGRLAEGVAGSVLHPLDTAATLGKTALGTLALAVPGRQDVEAYPRAIGQMFKDRYGSGEAIGRTLYEDPVGVAADLATALGGAGALAKLGSAGRIGKLATAGNALMKAGDVINPARLVTAPLAKAGELAGTAAAQITTRPGIAIGRQSLGDKYRVAREIATHRLDTPERASAHFNATVADAARTAGLAQVPDIPRGSIVAFPKTGAAIAKSPGHQTSATRELRGIERELTRNMPEDIPFQELFEYSRSFNREANPAYRGDARLPSGVPSIRPEAFREVAENTRTALYDAVPQLAGKNKAVQTAMLANQAVVDAAARPHALTRYLTVGAGMSGQVPAALAILATDSPRLGANLGYALTKIPAPLNTTPSLRALLAARLADALAREQER
jgi:hypothetical protein